MILIYGTGKVGNALTRLCEYQNISYELCDDSNHPLSYDRYEYIIPSPGVPGSHDIYSTGKVLSELDFAYRFLPKDFKIISITGTDGKSTTTWMAYNILYNEYFVEKDCTKNIEKLGKNLPVYLSGNFDIPFSGTVLEILKKGEKKGYIILEISSFMSHMIREFRTDFSLFTNFKADHLNWHKDLQEYLNAKMNLLLHTKHKAIINQQVIDFAHENSLEIILPQNIRIFQGGGKDRTDGEDIVISGRKKYKLSETHFSGFHNAMNLLSVGIIANEMKICSKRVKEYIAEIQGLPHRLEKIGEKRGILFVEDSKSTSSQSLEAALGAYGNTKNLLLIVGGSDKGDTFLYLAPIFQKRVKAMVCMGVTKDKFIQIAQQEGISFLATDSLEVGVNYLYKQGERNDVLMLSPGCASFGLFRDYLDRAHQFRDAIEKL